MDTIQNINQAQVDFNNNSRVSNERSNELDQDAFLRLFIASLQNQNPLEPMSQGEMMEQLTQLTMIENITKMSDAVDNLLTKDDAVNPLSNYFDLIGKQVRVQEGYEFFEGKVLSVGRQNNDIVFELDDGKAYYVNDIVGVSEIEAADEAGEVDEESEEETENENEGEEVTE